MEVNRQDGLGLPGSFQPYNTNASSATSLPAVPRVNTSFVLFAPSVRGDGAFEFLLLGRSNRNYTVEYTTDFNGWTNVTNVTLPGAQATAIDPGATNALALLSRPPESVGDGPRAFQPAAMHQRRHVPRIP